MHEYPITQQIVKMAEEHCREANAKRVRVIHLVCGDYSGFVPESIHMYFDIIAEDTLCDGAEIEIRRIQPKMRCPRCDELFVRRPLSFACPTCGAEGEPTDVGKEFYIESIEVE